MVVIKLSANQGTYALQQRCPIARIQIMMTKCPRYILRNSEDNFLSSLKKKRGTYLIWESYSEDKCLHYRVGRIITCVILA